jgi:hypothetical protein
VRRTAEELSSRDPRGAGGPVTLRRAIAVITLLAGAWLIVAVHLSPGAAAASSPSPTATPCHGVACSSPSVVPTATATAVPTPVPTPTPTPALPTVAPTPYSEAIVNGPPTGTLPSAVGNLTIIPHPSGSGSPLTVIGLVAMVALGILAGTGFFFFVRIR